MAFFGGGQKGQRKLQNINLKWQGSTLCICVDKRQKVIERDEARTNWAIFLYHASQIMLSYPYMNILEDSFCFRFQRKRLHIKTQKYTIEKVIKLM